MYYVPTISAYFLAGVFLFTGADKLFHYQGFTNALGSYEIVPNGVAQYLALPLILSELWVGLGLVVKSWRRTAAVISAALLTAFTVALTFNYFHMPGIPCGCWFSITLGTANLNHILMNLTLFGLAIFVWLDTGKDQIIAEKAHASSDSVNQPQSPDKVSQTLNQPGVPDGS